jgi:hypothetical protein
MGRPQLDFKAVLVSSNRRLGCRSVRPAKGNSVRVACRQCNPVPKLRPQL